MTRLKIIKQRLISQQLRSVHLIQMNLNTTSPHTMQSIVRPGLRWLIRWLVILGRPEKYDIVHIYQSHVVFINAFHSVLKTIKYKVFVFFNYKAIDFNIRLFPTNFENHEPPLPISFFDAVQVENSRPW